jgi:uncharacterized protein (TIGR02996 family)
MDHAAAARALVAELVRSKQIEVRRAEIVGRDLAKYTGELGRPPTGRELEAWLSEHRQVEEVYASTAALDELVLRHLTSPADVPADPLPPADARRTELVRQLRDDPDNPALYLVYADWLQEQGDPLGELIALGVATTATAEVARFESYLKQHETRLFGGIPRLRECVQLHWSHGMVSSINGTGAIPLAARHWAQLLKLPICELVRGLSVGSLDACTPALDEAIAVAAPPTLRWLSWTDHWPEQILKRGLHSLRLHGRNVGIAQAQVPERLEVLHLAVAGVDRRDPEPLYLPIRELNLLWCPPALLESLHATKLPHLERIQVSIDDGTIQSLAWWVARRDLGGLQHLALEHRRARLDPRELAPLVQALAATPLTSLALRFQELDDASVVELIAALRGLSLDELDVSDNELTDAGLATLRSAFPRVIGDRQRRRGHAFEQRVVVFAGDRLEAAEAIVGDESWSIEAEGDLQRARYTGEREYELYVSADLARWECTCRSWTRPCKHVVALALIAARAG